MALWSPTSTTLYFSRAAGVFRWTPGEGDQLMLPGVRWLYPTISPDGRYLAYTVATDIGTDAGLGVYLIDLARGMTPEPLHADRTLPVFLNSEQLWYASGEPMCGGSSSPKIYDLRDNTEYPSVIDSVGALWPATSAIH